LSSDIFRLVYTYSTYVKGLIRNYRTVAYSPNAKHAVWVDMAHVLVQLKTYSCIYSKTELFNKF